MMQKITIIGRSGRPEHLISQIAKLIEDSDIEYDVAMIYRAPVDDIEYTLD